MTLKYMPIKLFFEEFSHMKYMKSGGLYLLALYDGIYLHSTQSGAIAFLPLIFLTELLPQDFANWYTLKTLLTGIRRLEGKRKQNIMRSVTFIKG